MAGHRPGHGTGRRGYLLRGLAAGPGDHQDPDRGRAVRAARPAQADAPLGRAWRRGTGGGRGRVLVRGQERERRRGAGPDPRVRRPDRGGGPALPGVPGPAGPGGPARPGLGAAGPARSGPLPGPVGLRARRDQHRRAGRHDGLHPVRAAVRERPRLRRAQPGVEPGHRLRARSPARRARCAADRAPAAVRGGAGAGDRGRVRFARPHPARLDQCLPDARGGRAELERAGLCRHPPAAARVRDHGLPGQPRCRHPDHAARAVRHPAHAARPMARRRAVPAIPPVPAVPAATASRARRTAAWPTR